MGITIHYQGTIDRIEDIEELEDRIIDFAFSFGGNASVWRSYADHDPGRMIRGLILELEPGQDSMSLLISPEGQIINVFEIEEAERGPMREPSYCCVKTQFGSVFGHAAIVHLLEAIKKRFASNLRMSDDGGYSEHHDVNRLAAAFALNKRLIDNLADSLRHYGLSQEACEDPEIIASRVERIAALVKSKVIGSEPERGHQEVDDESDAVGERSLEDQVADQTRDYYLLLKRSERMMRRMSEREAQGDGLVDALHEALRDEGFSPRREHNDEANESEFTQVSGSDSESESEPWQESWNQNPYREEEEEEQDFEDHPVLQRAENCLAEMMKILDSCEVDSTFFGIASEGLMNTIGGLVQSLSLDRHGRGDRAYSIVQLRRALKGLGFFRGAVFGLRSANAIDDAYSNWFHQEYESIQEMVHELLKEAWEEQTDSQG